MKLLRVYEDQKGESHFDVVAYPMTLRDDSPPAKPHDFTEPEPAKTWTSVRCPPGWDGGLHPAPRRQIIICTAGACATLAPALYPTFPFSAGCATHPATRP